MDEYMDKSLDCETAIKKIDQYPPGKARSNYVRSLAVLYDVALGTIYRWHKQACPDTERKERADKGARSISEDMAEALGAMIFATKRQSQKILMSASTAKEVAQDSNMPMPDVCTSTINRRLREIQMSKAKIKQPSPHVRLATKHPNQLWEFDVSNCIQYHLVADKGLQERDLEMEFYKNKLKNFKVIKRELLRYVAVDHCAGPFFLRYFYTTGETSLNAAEFFLAAFQKKKDERYRFHGVPFYLYVDRGSAVKAEMIQGLLDRLSITCINHLPGNPRAKGLVEGLHDYIERNFESRLNFHRPHDLQEVNDWAFDWAVKVNAAVKFRNTAPRSQLWSYITNAQLRLCPPEEVYRHLLRAKPEKRKVQGLRIAYEGKFYNVPDVNLHNEWVEVTYSPYEYPNILVSHEYLDHPLSLSPCAEKDQYGRVTDGAVVFGPKENGELNYKRHKDTETQKRLKNAEKTLEEWGLTMKGTGDKRRAVAPALGKEKLTVFGNQADKVGNIAFMDKPGTALPIEMAVEVCDFPFMKAIKLIAERLGRGLSAHENDWIKKTYGSVSIPEGEIETIVERLSGAGGEKRTAAQGGKE